MYRLVEMKWFFGRSTSTIPLVYISIYLFLHVVRFKCASTFSLILLGNLVIIIV